MTSLNKAQFEDNCPKCARYQKQITRLKKAFIEADDENVRRFMKYEAAINRLKAEHNSEKSKQEAGVRRGCRTGF